MLPAVATRIDQDEQITGRQRVAILCMTLGAEATAKLTSKLNSDEIESISYEIARMDSVPTDIVHSVLYE